jgi:hypothetical protein
VSEKTCTCPVGRPIGAPHVQSCDKAEGEVLVFRQPDTGRPVGVPPDVVSAAERAYAAYEKKLKGMSWSQIAVEGFWPSAAACQAEVKHYLDEGRSALATWKRTEVIVLWRDRLEMLFASVITEAEKGKVPSVMAALAIAKTAMQLEGLDQPSEDDANVPTVVVPDNEGDYIRSLREQAGDIEPPGETA